MFAHLVILQVEYVDMGQNQVKIERKYRKPTNLDSEEKPTRRKPAKSHPDRPKPRGNRRPRQMEELGQSWGPAALPLDRPAHGPAGPPAARPAHRLRLHADAMYLDTFWAVSSVPRQPEAVQHLYKSLGRGGAQHHTFDQFHCNQ